MKPVRLFFNFLILICAALPSAMDASEILIGRPEELSESFAAARPGDTLVLADREWRDVEILFRANGTAADPITLRAQTPGKVVLSGESSLRLIGSHLVVDGLVFQDGFVESGDVIAFRNDEDETASDCRLTNTAIIDYNSPAGGKQGSVWVSLYGQRNRVDHCFFKNKTSRNPMMVVWLNGEPAEHRVDFNRFSDRPELGKNGGEIVRIGDSQTSMQNARTVLEHNYFENCDGEVEIISNKSCENIYRHNTFVRSAGALVLRHGNRCLVEGNYFLGENKPGTGGIRVIGEDHRVINNYLSDLAGDSFKSALPLVAGIPDSAANGYFQVRRALIAFNTLVNCRESMIFGVGAGDRGRRLAPEDCTVANNVIWSSQGPLIRPVLNPARTLWLANFAFGAEVGMSVPDGLLKIDPELIKKAPAGLWQPSKDSPVVGSAKGEFPDVVTDIFGRSRGSKKDAGCFQAGSTDPIRFPPLTSSDVGPEWMKSGN